jgi:hypothetical protein
MDDFDVKRQVSMVLISISTLALSWCENYGHLSHISHPDPDPETI